MNFTHTVFFSILYILQISSLYFEWYYSTFIFFIITTYIKRYNLLFSVCARIILHIILFTSSLIFMINKGCYYYVYCNSNNIFMDVIFNTNYVILFLIFEYVIFLILYLIKQSKSGTKILWIMIIILFVFHGLCLIIGYRISVIAIPMLICMISFILLKN